MSVRGAVTRVNFNVSVTFARKRLLELLEGQRAGRDWQSKRMADQRGRGIAVSQDRRIEETREIVFRERERAWLIL